MRFLDIRSYTETLRKQGDLAEVSAEVDPFLEIAEIHRRVVEAQGPALLFRNVKNSPYPVVTNLFGSKKRVDLAFGERGLRFIERAAELFPPSPERLWAQKGLLKKLLFLGTKSKRLSSAWSVEVPANLDTLPILTTWPKDGGPFLTLPLVYTEHPDTGVHNLGMYRMQKFSSYSTGLHMQVGKGGGFHLSRAQELGVPLPVNVFLGGPPAAILSSIAPLPEDIPELLLASLLLGEKLEMAKSTLSTLPVLNSAEFVLIGSIHPEEVHTEGPFGDHYGYYSKVHDYPLFRCKALLKKKDALYPATVVGKPRQEDFYIANYIQELFAPLIPATMPGITSLWSYGETGYHPLAAAVVKERYKHESAKSAFRILGESQLSLTKFLILVNKEMNLRDFPPVLEHVLERADLASDLYILSNLSMDTLDFTGPRLNEGSKAVLMGFGEPIRALSGEFSGALPQEIECARVFCRGCLVLSGATHKESPELAKRVAKEPCFSSWPLIILSDDAKRATENTQSFLWTTFTRFEPAADITSASIELKRYHPSFGTPIVIDCRMKPGYPEEVSCDDETSSLVDRRWGEYFGEKV